MQPAAGRRGWKLDTPFCFCRGEETPLQPRGDIGCQHSRRLACPGSPDREHSHLVSLHPFPCGCNRSTENSALRSTLPEHGGEENEGLFQILIGLFRKIVIADNLGVYVDAVYLNPEIYGSATLILATVFYAFQIYYDFAGYSDIAIGSAKLLGFRFNQNFNL